MTLIESIEQQARMLADDYREGDPGITKVYWFPDDREVRVISLLEEIPPSPEGVVSAFYFRPSPADGLTAPSRVAIIKPDEFGQLKLPNGWVGWQDAIEV